MEVKKRKNIKNVEIYRIYLLLLDKYGYQNWWPIVQNEKCLYLQEYGARERTPEEIEEIMIGAILTQNTAWENVRRAIVNLKKHNMIRWKNLLKADTSQLSDLIRSSGYYKQKAKKLKKLAEFISEELKGDILLLKRYSLQEARKKLLSLWGVGPETADSILLYGYYFKTFVVDAYTKRIFSRIGLINLNDDYNKVKGFFEKNLPEDRIVFQEYHALIVEFGKKICRNSPLCGECFLKSVCKNAK